MTTALDTRKSVVKGSLADVAKQAGQSLAQTFVNAEVVILVDTSGSMNTTDGRGGRKRYDVAVEELTALQAQLPGKVAVLSFSGQVMFCPSGTPYYFGGSTDMAEALRFAHIADVPGIRFILISDGEPDNSTATLAEARQFRAKIDTIFVGPETGSGRDFLARLAAASGGQSVTAAHAIGLLGATQKLLAA